MNPEQEQLFADHIGYAHHLANIRNRSVPAIWRGDMHSAAGWLCQDLLALLNWDERAIAERYFLHGMTLAEIARLEGVTESRICQRMGAIKRRLRQLAVRTELAAA